MENQKTKTTDMTGDLISDNDVTIMLKDRQNGDDITRYVTKLLKDKQMMATLKTDATNRDKANNENTKQTTQIRTNKHAGQFEIMCITVPGRFSVIKVEVSVLYSVVDVYHQSGIRKLEV